MTSAEYLAERLTIPIYTNILPDQEALLEVASFTYISARSKNGLAQQWLMAQYI